MADIGGVPFPPAGTGGPFVEAELDPIPPEAAITMELVLDLVSGFVDDNPAITMNVEPTSAPAPVGDIIPPVIGNFDPTPGSALARTDPVAFDVTDDSGSFIRIFVVAFFATIGDQEVIHDGGAFVGRYSAASSRVPITNGFRYTVTRNGGWLGPPTIRIFPIDAAGNQT